MRRRRKAQAPLLFAIDPGNVQSAWLVWDGEKIVAFGLEENEAVRRRLRDAPSTYSQPLHLVYERFASFGMLVGKSVFDTCIWIGRFQEVFWTTGPIDFLYRKTVVGELCGSGKAKDSNVRRALLDLVGEQGKKKAPGPTYGLKKDLWSALAIAIVGWRKFVEKEL